jgi:uncharacterized CHY-type Zn-finger protein
MVSGLGQEACIKLDSCKHIFHVSCLSKKILPKWPSPRMTFDFCNCSACKTPINLDHPELTPFLNKIYALKRDMEQKAVAKAKVEGLDKDPSLMAPPYSGDLMKFAVFKCAYYLCFSCDKPYFGGMKDCIRAQQEQQEFKPQDLVCGTCAAEKLGVG